MDRTERKTNGASLPKFAEFCENYALCDGLIFDGKSFKTDLALLIEGNMISGLVSKNELSRDVQNISVNGAVIAPGFVDLQLNGCGGVMFNDAISCKTLDKMHATNLRSGCTSFMPTLISTSDENMLSAMQVLADYRTANGHANVLGLHLEGPYINKECRGIHSEDNIRRLSATMRDKLCEYAQTTPLILTLAPECVADSDISMLAYAGALVSIGHSNATYEETIQGIQAGAGTATHLFNAMSQWRSREPGVVGAILEAGNVSCSMIVDGIHSHFASIFLAKKLKNDRCFLVTDATAAAASDISEFTFSGQTVRVSDGKCVNADGTLGGSSLTMIKAVENCVRHAGISLEESLRMASTYPAKVMMQGHSVGRTESGFYANLAIFSPESFKMVATIDRGKVYFWE